MELISVIIPVYNAEKYLKKCLNSIQGQTYKNIEIIVVDDGSIDNSSDIYTSISKEDVRVRIIRMPNMGVSNARNVGLEHSNGEYIVFCDADDFMENNMLERLYDCLKTKPVELSICGYRRFHGDNVDNNQLLVEGYLDRKATFESVMRVEQCRGYLWNKMFLSKIINSESKIRFSKKLAILEDQCFVLEYIERINQSYILSDPLYNYRINPEGAMHQGLNERMLSILHGMEMTYNLLARMDASEDILSETWNQLIKTCCVYFRNVPKCKMVNRKYWLNEILRIIKSLNQHSMDGEWNRKDIITLKVLQIIVAFKK